MPVTRPKEGELWSRYVLQVTSGHPQVLTFTSDDPRAAAAVQFDGYKFLNTERCPWKNGSLAGTLLITNEKLVRNPHNGYEMLYEACVVHNLVGRVIIINWLRRDGSISQEVRKPLDEFLRDYGKIADSHLPSP